MSLQFGKLISLLLLEHFGEIVQKVGFDLYKCQSKPLQLIVASTKLPVPKVRTFFRNYISCSYTFSFIHILYCVINEKEYNCFLIQYFEQCNMPMKKNQPGSIRNTQN